MELIEAKITDAKILFEWRNDIITRKSFFNTDEIKWDDHLVWLEKTIADPNKKLFICKLLNEKIGTVRADWCGEYYEMSWTISPEFRGKGLASEMVSLIFKNLKGLVRAEIKVSNTPSTKIAKSLNMKLINTIKGVHHFEIIID